MMYLARKIKELDQRATRLAHGLPIGDVNKKLQIWSFLRLMQYQNIIT
ncbi:MAG: hypothetical protein UU36_C0028G0006 [Candidatus Uhrbacteria bacterium GW2011_GWE2_41_1153]|nr:MAG: hypothetical protein UU36_C0028G0006 [Candidatus Uhrbacteria bacterium GW2011_GWE2_41_1153]